MRWRKGKEIWWGRGFVEVEEVWGFRGDLECWGCGWLLVGLCGGGMEVRVLTVWCAEGVVGVLVVMCGGGQTGHAGKSHFREPQ